MRLKDKVAVVTAAGAGIGRATALAFAAEGASVVACDIDEASMRALAVQEAGIHAAVVDMRDDRAVANFFGTFAPCDILFNCAGMVPGGSVLDSGPDIYAATFDLNVLSMVRSIRAALPAMLRRGQGTILNVASVASSITGVPNRSAYATSKAAVIGLTKSITADFPAIRCNALCPGTVDTPSLRARIAAQPDPEAALKAFHARQPLGRFARADEVAAMAVYLASDEAAFITGQTFIIDGGWTN